MKYKAGFLRAIIGSPWSLETSKIGLICFRSDQRRRFSYFDITALRIEQGTIFDTLKLTVNGQTHKIEGLSKRHSNPIIEDLTAQIKEAVALSVKAKKVSFGKINNYIDEILAQDDYLSQNDIRKLIAKIPYIGHELAHPYFDVEVFSGGEKKALARYKELIQPDSNLVKKRNESYCAKTLKKFNDLFDRLEKYPLTLEQKTAAIINEDRNLLIAAAGSGKSSTIVAKVAYLIEKGLATSSEVLILTYNKDAQEDIDARINKLVGTIPSFKSPVLSKTFHALGLEVIAQVEGVKPSIPEVAAAGKIRTLNIFNEMVEQIRRKNPVFDSKWQIFQSSLKSPLPDIFSITSYSEYNEYQKQAGASLKNSNFGKRLMLLTMDGNEVKSVEEARLANFLYMSGVRYEYEKNYSYPTSNKDYRQYCPDFYYPEADLYHEHFAINEFGTPPSFLGSKYLEGVSWKRKLHASNNTKLIETHSADFFDGSCEKKLLAMLQRHNISFNPPSADEVDQRIKESFDPETDIQIFITILRHFKANAAELSWLQEKANSLHDPNRTEIFIDLFETIYKAYQEKLGDQIDFEDQINIAATYIEEGKYTHGYKYILVDEFQDISQDRKRILDALLNQDEEIKLFAVGDDWQSIYRFSGSDIDIMTNFSDNFGATYKNYLTQTFRSYQGLVDVAANFIQRNPQQLKKKVTALVNVPQKQVFIDEYQSERDQERKLESRLEQLDRIAKQRKCNYKVFILTRYHRQKPSQLDLYEKKFTSLELTCRTIHASKGLEADYVLLLNVSDKRYGFPSKIFDDPLLGLVIPKPEEYPYAEERRLLYVAMTRAKRALFILADASSISCFVKELSNYKDVKVSEKLRRKNPCPSCETGELRERNGKYGRFMGCSNYPRCKHITRFFDPEK